MASHYVNFKTQSIPLSMITCLFWSNLTNFEYCNPTEITIYQLEYIYRTWKNICLPVLILAVDCKFELDLAAKLLRVCQVDLLSLYNIPALLIMAALCSCWGVHCFDEFLEFVFWFVADLLFAIDLHIKPLIRKQTSLAIKLPVDVRYRYIIGNPTRR